MAYAFKRGEKYRVVKAGARLTGLQPIVAGRVSGQESWGRPLTIGEVLTCAGSSMTFGDGVPAVKWLNAEGHYIANDCTFHPSTGTFWTSKPDESYLEPVA